MNPDNSNPSHDSEPKVHALNCGSNGQWRVSRRGVLSGAASGGIISALTGCEGKILETAHEGAVHDMIESNGNLYSCGADHRLKKWNLSEASPTEELLTLPPGQQSWQTLASEPGTGILIAAASASTLFRWSRGISGKPQSISNITLSAPRCLCSADGVSLLIDEVSGSESAKHAGKLVIVNPSSRDLGEPLRTVAEKELVRALGVMPRSETKPIWLVKQSQDDTICCFERSNSFTIKTGISGITRLVVDLNVCVASNLAGEVWLINLDTSKVGQGIFDLNTTSAKTPDAPKGRLLKATSSEITCLTMNKNTSNSNFAVAAGCADGRVIVINRMKPGITRNFQAHQGKVTAVAFYRYASLDRLATAGVDGKILLWDLTTGQEQKGSCRAGTRAPKPSSSSSSGSSSGGGSRSSGSHYWRPN